jgi:hypothetical protein
VALVGGVQGGSPAAAPVAASHVLRFSPEVLDLGELSASTPAHASVTVTNISAQPVTVKEIKAGCGCTKTSEAPKEPVAPGASFTVQLTMDPGKRTGIEFSKAVHVILADGWKETLQMKGRVKTVLRAEPAVIDLGVDADGGTPALTLNSVDGKDFTITSVVPEGMLGSGALRSAGGSGEFKIDLAAWERAGQPSSLVLTTDRADAPEVAVPVKVSEAVAMFRLPSAADSDPKRQDIWMAQDALINRIDAGLPASVRSGDFRMRLHRESGMLFVHGSTDALKAVREAVKALPADSGVRESTGAPPA